jgi:fatty acid desaturase
MSISYTRHRFNEPIRKQLFPLTKLDNWHSLVAVAYDYSVIAAAITLFYLQPWCYPISVILIGSRQRALGALSHEAIHRRVAKSSTLNYFIGTFLTGYLIIQEHHTYQDTHIRKHHIFLGDPKIDTDYRYHIDEKLYQFHDVKDFIRQFILKPLFLLKTFSYLWPLLRWRMFPRKKHFMYFLKMYAYLILIVATLAWFHWLKYLLLLWVIPLITSAGMISWFNEIAEHYPLVGKYNLDLWMTRNRFSHPLEHFIFNNHNENYHLVHHLFPAITFWNAKKAHEVLMQDPDYAKVNENIGGIFLSGNNQPSLMQLLLTAPAISRDGTIQFKFP